MSILDEIIGRTRLRIEEKKRLLPLERLKEKAAGQTRGGQAVKHSAEQYAKQAVPCSEMPAPTAQPSAPFITPDFLFERAISGIGLSFICEIKRASPSKGDIITGDFSPVQIAKRYEAANADAISVLTEPYYFKGDDGHLLEISQNVNLPLLRKDFVVDEYMIYEARLLGASAVLLIASALAPDTLGQYLKTARFLGLSALVETRTKEQIKAALGAGAKIIGVNNRDLNTFKVDLIATERLREYVPSGIPFVSESGIQTAGDIRRLAKCGVDAVLVGEALMKSGDIEATLSSLKKAANNG
jgi:indole-3-glycerol phosphate synthase